MAITFDETDITAIQFYVDGAYKSIYGVQYDDVGVWALSSTLTIYSSATSYATVTVNRTSSPYGNASLGIIASGSKVYYGDKLTITVKPPSGYTLSSFQINSNTYTSSPRTITVDIGGVSISNVKTTSSSTWKTLYSGSSRAQSSSSSASQYTLSPTITIPSSATQIRITGSYSSQGGTTKTFTNLVISLSSSQTTYTFTSYVKLLITKGSYLKAQLQSSAFGGKSVITITKVEYI